MGRVTAVQCVGGMTLGEEAAVGKGMWFTQRRVWGFLRGIWLVPAEI